MEINTPTTIIGDAVAGQSATLRKRMRLLAGDLTRYTFDLAEAFLLAQETRCYAEWGFESLPEYAEVELGVKPRKAQYLARIAKVCRDCGVKRADYEPVGITKLREITTLNPETLYYNTDTKQHESMVDHIVRLIAEAPELGTVEVEQEVMRLKGMTGENRMVHRGYMVTESCWDNVIKVCLESIRKRLGSAGRDGTGQAREYTDGNCYEALCAEYNSDPRNFMEEPDESHEQIEVPLEETNDHTPNQEGTGSHTKISGTDIPRSGDSRVPLGETNPTLDTVDSTEVPQEPLQGPSQPFVIPTD